MPGGNTLRQAAMLAAEQALNEALELDPPSREALAQILARPVVVQISVPAVSFYLLADDRQLRIQQTCGDEPALTIQGSLLALIALGLGDRTPLQQGRVMLEGDAALAGKLQSLLEKLQPDWEGALARVLGDIPAHLLARQVRRLLGWGRDTHQRLRAMVEEYLHEESPSVPGRKETEAFFEDIAELQLAADRLSARLDQLANQAPPATKQESP